MGMKKQLQHKIKTIKGQATKRTNLEYSTKTTKIVRFVGYRTNIYREQTPMIVPKHELHIDSVYRSAVDKLILEAY